MPRSEAVTEGIRVEVESRYHPDRSEPGDGQWFFGYTVRITNEGTRTAQLLNRHWIITDADGQRQEVCGPGVVGQQPVLLPGQSFKYTSFCPLNTSFGTMHGTYQMAADDGRPFDVEIAPFALGEEHSIN